MGCISHRKRRGLGGDIFSGALQGLGAGSTFGPIGAGIGALVGGIGGFFGGKKREEMEQQAARRKALIQEAGDYFQDVSHLQAFNNQFNAALGVDMSLSSPSLGGLNVEISPDRLASDVFRMNGPSHSNGGVDVDSNLDGIAEYELEGGEVTRGHQVFSKRLKVPQEFIDHASEEGFNLKKGTYSQIAESLGRNKNKYEEKMDSLDRVEANTGMIMIERIENLYNDLFYTQEFSKLKKR